MMRETIVIRIVRMICFFEPCMYKCVRSLTRVKLKHVCIVFGILMLLDLFGIFTHIFERSYRDHFTYPYEGNIQPSVEALKNNQKPDIEPINQYNYSYIHDIKNHCVDNDYHTLRIIFLIKSACGNFDHRRAIRNSWGSTKHFLDVPTRTLFLLGKKDDDEEMQIKIDEESELYRDIMQADFIDSYYNNTIKTMMGFKWVMTHCLNSKYYMFVDDDMYVSVKNVLRFIRNPASYRDYSEEPSSIGSVQQKIHEPDMSNIAELLNDSEIKVTADYPEFYRLNELQRYGRAGAKKKMMVRRESDWMTHNESVVPMSGVINAELNYNQTSRVGKLVNSIEATSKLQNSTMDSLSNDGKISDFEIPDDVRLFAGRYQMSKPLRDKTSKWYVSLKEYAFDFWPPFVPAGSYILSRSALIDMYYTSFYTKHFRFDDVYLGFVAKKANIHIFHSEDFHLITKHSEINYKYAIAVHGHGNFNRVLEIWNEQRSLGNT